jgi:large subunit ribosomal protein L24
MKIKKDDNVIIITGKDKGKKGKVLRVFRGDTKHAEKVIVEGANMLKRHQRARKEGQKGEVVSVAAPIHISNIKKA